MLKNRQVIATGDVMMGGFPPIIIFGLDAKMTYTDSLIPAKASPQKTSSDGDPLLTIVSDDNYKGFWSDAINDDYTFWSPYAESLMVSPEKSKSFSPDMGNFKNNSRMVSLHYARREEMHDILSYISKLSEYIREVEMLIPSPDFSSALTHRPLSKFNLIVKGEDILFLRFFFCVLQPFDRCCLSMYQNRLIHQLPIDISYDGKAERIAEWKHFINNTRRRCRGIFQMAYKLNKEIKAKMKNKPQK